MPILSNRISLLSRLSRCRCSLLAVGHWSMLDGASSNNSYSRSIRLIMQVLSNYLRIHHIDPFLLAVLRSDAGTTNATTATRGVYASANGSPGATTPAARVDTATAIFTAATHFFASSAYRIWIQQSICT